MNRLVRHLGLPVLLLALAGMVGAGAVSATPLSGAPAVAAGAPRFVAAAAEPERAKRTFQGVPTVASVDGRLWVAFYGDDKIAEEGAGNYIVLKRSDDRGRSWSEIGYVVADEPGMRALDPQLWRDPDGALWLLFTTTRGVSDLRYGVYAVVIDKPGGDPDPKAMTVRRLAEAGIPGRPVLVGDRVLLPVDLRESSRSPLFPSGTGKWIYQLDYKRRALTRVGRIPDTPDVVSYQETSLAPLGDGSVLAMFRTRQGQYASRSEGADLNRWSPPERWAALPPNPETRARLIPLPDGALAVAFNDDPRRRKRMTLALSTDGGRTLARTFLLKGGAASYPDLAFDGRGDLIAVWDTGRATKREIAGAFVSESALSKGEARPERFVVDRQGAAAAREE